MMIMDESEINLSLKPCLNVTGTSWQRKIDQSIEVTVYIDVTTTTTSSESGDRRPFVPVAQSDNTRNINNKTNGYTSSPKHRVDARKEVDSTRNKWNDGLSYLRRRDSGDHHFSRLQPTDFSNRYWSDGLAVRPPVILRTDSDEESLFNVKPAIKTVENGLVFHRLDSNLSQSSDYYNHLSAHEAVEFASKGGFLTKIRNGGRHPRFFKMHTENFILEYKSAKKLCCKPGQPIYELNGVQEIRVGQNTETFKEYRRYIPVDCCFSVIFFGSSRISSLDLVAADMDTRDKWVRGLKCIIARHRNVGLSKKKDRWIENAFKKADRNNDGSLNLKEIHNLLPVMNIHIKKNKVEEMFETANTNKKPGASGEQSLDMDEFVAFIHNLQKRQELMDLFEEYSDDAQYMTTEDLRKFLKHEQGQDKVPDLVLNKMIEQYEPSPEVKEERMLSFEGFQFFMMYDQTIFNPVNEKSVCHNMNEPICNYFINSSHNTYLMDNQLTGMSSIEAYIRALELGCRCVEMDCWDGPDNEPVIYHGYTLTSKIRFRDVIDIVNTYAFKTSPYPVILSLENHCSIEQQKVMARILLEILGNKLYTTPVLCKVLDQLPSPAELKGKILIKGKKFPSEDVAADDEAEVSDEDEAADIKQDEVEITRKKSSKKLKLARELSDLVVCCKSVSFKGFEYAINNNKSYEMSSLVEHKMKKFAERDASDFVKANKRFLTRVYPDGGRTDSSNYEPCVAWNTGCQIVALNFQTPSKAMHLNLGKYRDNGRSGYVLKPDFLRDGKVYFDPRGPFHESWKKIVTINVISGYQLPKTRNKKNDITDPYVKVKIYGVDADKQKTKTKVVKNNGFNPIWNEEFRFVVQVPQLALLRFVAYDDNAMSDAKIAQYTVPFQCIMPGYRHVPLLKENGELCKDAYLFVHMEII
ncbi:1-phosphatidylinositol 4,5-bisphosphate phosphodiesterase delta-1-like isoform X2 [Tubulanus polymorphus]|uniref:1-phosphatidylinositol 4,5-bisphosphate phosphodiesterase delta-1-like isoform X2 n=1 Tax=Tubulanus polymorphus TaxID=672921 RepID=UPI003DA39038